MVCGAASVAVILAEATISPALPNLSLFSRGLHALQVERNSTVTDAETLDPTL